MKPLYLESRKGIRVFLDGPALLVRCAGEADRLYPVERLSRVVSHPAVSWEQEALLCLLGKDIPVIFIDDRGTVVARTRRCWALAASALRWCGKWRSF